MGDEQTLLVGIFDGASKSSDNDSELSIAQYGAVNEFGTSRAGRNNSVTIPARPFIRPVIDRFNGKYHRLLRIKAEKVLKGRGTIKGAMIAVGSVIEGDIVQRIISLRTPANADSTKKKKGSSNPLVDNNDLTKAITKEVK